MTTKLVVIGAGMASGRMLEHLTEAAPDAFDITLFSAEPRGNYNRIMLSPCSQEIRHTKTSSPTTTNGMRPGTLPAALARG